MRKQPHSMGMMASLSRQTRGCQWESRCFMVTGKLTVSSNLSPFPFSALAIAAFNGTADIVFDDSVSTIILDLDGDQFDEEEAIVHALSKDTAFTDDKIKTYFTLARSLKDLTTYPDIIEALGSLDDRLAFRTLLVSHEITSADWMVWGAFKINIKLLGLLKNNQHVHLLRWFNHLESLESTQKTISNLASAKANKARSNKTAAKFALGLQNAKEGHVITRFPPEPSGYLHIGHAKAAILNQHFAKMYKGKMIIRFDDTNPSKEKMEFEETILDDLQSIKIHGDMVTHTSDYFDQLYEFAVKLINEGKAYTDNTQQEQMRKERFDGIASAHRDDTVQENLKHFAEMKAGIPEGYEWCLRAKISVDDPNKALRDPVIYRCNSLPHHRTGDKWKIYPTYDFACPLVDSMEGVTHALRTSEYRDRDPQHQWMIQAAGLRPVEIWDYSRLSFIYTFLSKRKLRRCIELGLARGWDDPRFPTVRGIRRRGLTVEALTQFMLSQGPSSAIVSLEWDSIWVFNKKIIDPIAPRHWAILKHNKVPVKIIGGPASVEVKMLPKHKKNSEVGQKKTVYSSQIMVEQEDAVSFVDQEEITLMDWGNAFVRSKTVNATGIVISIDMELNLDGDFRKTKKKITWLAQASSSHQLVDVTLLDYDYLITKKKLAEDDKLEDVATPVTEFRDEALADANVLDLKKGDIIQFERKGYFVLDGEVDGRLEFIQIPDGSAASVASKAAVSQSTKTPIPQEASSSITGLPVPTKMYNVAKVYRDDVKIPVDTKMYEVRCVYDSQS